MDPERYSAAKRLFLEALERPEAERRDWIAAGAADPDLRGDVLALLEAHGRENDLLERSAAEALAIGPPERLPESVAGYRIHGLLGRGGMGSVYRARRGDEPEVALKMLDAGILSGRLNSRLRREAEALRRLQHPSIARFIETGTYDTPLGPQPYVAMELVEGTGLRERATDPGWNLKERVAFVTGAAAALAYAHAQGVIHRDLKPDNLRCAAGDRPVILDFGIARVTQGEGTEPGSLTLTGDVIGTVHYMSPEQAQGLTSEIDGRSDVYSLAVVAYELFAGTSPYRLATRSLTRALVQVATEPPRPLGLVRRDLKGGLEAILEKALEKRPADRYADAAAFADDLARWLDGRPVQALRGRRVRRLRALARSRAGLVVAMTAAATAVLAVALLSLPAVRHRVPPLAEADRMRLLGRLDAADELQHASRTSLEGLRRALDGYQGVRNALDSYPHDRLTEDLVRYSEWRIGETHYMIGAADHDMNELQSADEAFLAMANIHRPRGYRPPLDPLIPVAGRMAAFTPEQGLSGSGIARMELARYRDPAFNVRRALDSRVRALGEVGIGLGADGPRTPSGAGLETDQTARLLNETGEALAAYADLVDSLALFRPALGCLGAARAYGHLQDEDRVAYASVLENLGEVQLALARRGATAALDTAARDLGEALAIRIEWRRRSRAETRLALAEVERLRALGVSPARARPHWDAADAWVAGSAADLVADTAAAAARVPMWIERARVALDRAQAGDDAAAIGRARMALDSAFAVLATRPQPRPLASLEWLRARVTRLGAVAMDSTTRGEARGHLARARELVPADQDLPFARLLAAEDATLERPRPGTAPSRATRR
jgi:tRNA A-37 threonylcarbamoyl transferase component Bud32